MKKCRIDICRRSKYWQFTQITSSDKINRKKMFLVVKQSFFFSELNNSHNISQASDECNSDV